MANDVVVGLPSSRVRELTGVPSSTLHYWVQTGLVTPGIRGSSGHRVEWLWTLQEVLAIRVIRALRTAGASLQQIRTAKDELDNWGQDFTGVRLYWDGTDLVLSDQHGSFSVLDRPGQGMLQMVVLPLDDWHQEHSGDAAAAEYRLADLRQERERHQEKLEQRQPARRALLAADSGDEAFG